MERSYTYEATLAASQKASWRLEDLIGADKQLDFGKPFLPESLARVAGLDFLSAGERQLLNQIRGHNYLYLFGCGRGVHPALRPGSRRGRSCRATTIGCGRCCTFAGEEAKHIHLFKRFREEFREGLRHRVRA